MKAKTWTDEERQQRAELAKRRGRTPMRWTPERGGWTVEEVAFLGTDRDEAIPRKLKRTRHAVTVKRVRLGIAAFSGNAGGGRDWKDHEIELLGTAPDEVVATKIDRTAEAVRQKRTLLKIRSFEDRRQNRSRH